MHAFWNRNYTARMIRGKNVPKVRMRVNMRHLPLLNKGSVMNWIAVGKLEDIPRQGSRVVNTSNGAIAVFRSLDDELFALDNRSEEHTSELQSQFHLVCRLLLEKK